MEPNHHLPFEVGQEAESKSFLAGYRGAWFRCKRKERCPNCKSLNECLNVFYAEPSVLLMNNTRVRIKNIEVKKGHIGHALEFFDFPDEKVGWTKLYQKPPYRVSQDERKMHLMVRPRFPLFYLESQMPDICTISEVIAVVNDIWKVGDLVDWWTDGCYWSGKITHLLGEDKVQIDLPEPPVGEGKYYEAFCKDLRPSLDWSPEQGWTVPISTESDTCARLIQPVNEDKGTKDDNSTKGASIEFSSASLSSYGSAGSKPPPEVSSHPPTKEMVKKPLDGTLNNEKTQSLDKDSDLVGVTRKHSFSDSVSSSHVQDTLAATDVKTSRRDRYNYGMSPKKMKVGGNGCLNSSFSDTIESSILDLEELVNKIKWLKRVHEFGIPLSNATLPSWKFLENRASFTRR